VQEDPALVEVRFVGGACLGDLASKGAGHGHQHSRPCIVGVGLCREGDEALEGPGLVEVVPFSLLGSGAALMPVDAAIVAGGASGVLVVLAFMGAAGAAPVISGVPPR
jgi:hypothetical protein